MNKRLPNSIRELSRSKFPSPVHMMPGDTISLWDGNTKLMEETATKTITFTEGVLFEADAGVFGKGRALGGAFIEGD